ncbi:MAG: AAA family ATPase [Acidimicrobiia bacterium]
MTAPIHIIVAGAVGVANALTASQLFEQVHYCASGADLRDLIAAGVFNGRTTSDLIIIFADNLPDGGSGFSAEELIGRLTVASWKVAVIDSSGLGRNIVTSHPSAGLLTPPFSLNNLLGAISGTGIVNTEPVDQPWAWEPIELHNPEPIVTSTQQLHELLTEPAPWDNPTAPNTNQWGQPPQPGTPQPTSPPEPAWAPAVPTPTTPSASWDTSPPQQPYTQQTNPWGGTGTQTPPSPNTHQTLDTAQTPNTAGFNNEAVEDFPTNTWGTSPTKQHDWDETPPPPSNSWGTPEPAPVSNRWEEPNLAPQVVEQPSWTQSPSQPEPTPPPSNSWGTPEPVPPTSSWGETVPPQNTNQMVPAPQPEGNTAGSWGVTPTTNPVVSPSNQWETQPVVASDPDVLWGNPNNPALQEAPNTTPGQWNNTAAVTSHPAGSYQNSFPATTGGRKGIMISVAVPKGGAGKSTLALNLGVYLGLRTRNLHRTVCIIDANVQQADLGKYIHQYTPSIVTLARQMDDLQHDRINKHLFHLAGLNTSFLLGPQSSEESNPLWITPQLYTQVVDILRGLYDYIIVDTPVAEPHHELFRDFIIPSSDFLIVPTAPNYTTIANTDDWLRWITLPTPANGGGFDPDRLGVVLNRAEEDIGCSEAEVRTELAHWRYLGQIPESRAFKQAANAGEIVATRNLPDLSLAFSQVLYAATGEEILKEGFDQPTKSKSSWWPFRKQK